MSAAALFESLLAVGRAEDFEAVAALPGAGVHAQVLRFSESLRRTGLEAVEKLAPSDRIAFAKALAVYENSVRGLGSVTALQLVLPLIRDTDHALLDWILSNTTSYWYYAHGAKSLAELQAINAAHAARSAQNQRREAERERIAKARKAEKASQNLFNAVRRGDLKAVQGLLHQGASAQSVTPDGVPLVQYAESLNRAEIAALLRQAQSGPSAA
jgi:hypothetical protein